MLLTHSYSLLFVDEMSDVGRTVGLEDDGGSCRGIIDGSCSQPVTSGIFFLCRSWNVRAGDGGAQQLNVAISGRHHGILGGLSVDRISLRSTAKDPYLPCFNQWRDKVWGTVRPASWLYLLSPFPISP